MSKNSSFKYRGNEGLGSTILFLFFFILFIVILILIFSPHNKTSKSNINRIEILEDKIDSLETIDSLENRIDSLKEKK